MSNELLNKLLKEYSQKKTNAEIDLTKRKEALLNSIPRLKEIEDELNNSAIQTAKNILINGNKNVESLTAKIEKLKLEKEQILIQNGYDISYLQPFYECKKCNDSGYVFTDNKEVMCSCLKQRLLNEAFNKSNISNLDKENFSKFNSLVYSNDVDIARYKFNISPRQNIENIKNKSIEFIKNFDDPNSKNLLFTGNSGLRKNIYVQLYCR